jgi:CRP/FNR family nitrogen fixation transcriptional regulator
MAPAATDGVAVLLDDLEAHERNAWLGELAELESEAVEFKRGREIYGEDDPAPYVWQVARGTVASLKAIPDGRRQIVAFHFPGDLMGFLQPERYFVTAEAICDTQLLRIARTRIDRARNENPELARQIARITAQGLQRVEGHKLLLGRMTATERVAAFLLEMDQRLGAEDGAITLSMSRRDIADYLGLTLETVSRTMGHFTRAGTANITGQRIKLRRRNLLAECLSGENGRSLQSIWR